MIKSDNFVSEYNVCTQALNESRHTFIQGMDRTHIGVYYEKGNFNFSNVSCLEKSTRYSIIVLFSNTSQLSTL